MKDTNLKLFTEAGLDAPSAIRPGNVSRLVSTLMLLAVWAVTPGDTSHAQRNYAPVRVSALTAQVLANQTVVTVSADNALTRPQTWQDEEGFHVVLPNTVSADRVKAARGVKLRSVGTSLEILAQSKPGSRVSVSASQNELKLVIDGKLENRNTESAFRVSSDSSDEWRLSEASAVRRNQNEVAQLQAPPALPASQVESLSGEAPVTTSVAANAPSPSVVTAPSTQPSRGDQIVAQGDDSAPPPAPPITVRAEDESFLSSIFSGTSVIIVFGLGLVGLLVSRKMRSKQQVSSTKGSKGDQGEASVDGQTAEVTQTASKSLVRVGESSIESKASRQAVTRAAAAGPTTLYGAYRIDQEVGKLTLGQPHRIDVLASRALDDRRAIEASLIKSVNSKDLDESAQRRAREALEEYGFVARQCASLLLAPDVFERSSAARALGEIKSPAALPFLLEALYDSESIVRNQAVASIGELKLPSAIGALLDIARTHPDVPNSLLSRTLSACSVEGLDFFDAIAPNSSSLLGPGDVGSIIEEITYLEPSMPIENLPQSSDDEVFLQALAEVDSEDAEKRAEALKTLVQFRVQSSVDAIARIARHDPKSTIRSLAISSLGSISHESVFATVLIGMADESREVRAAAARSVNRLSFDRADAYVRVMETSDEETLCCVAKACVQAGIVSQNLDRLANADHRQAYETLALISLLTKARMNEPVLEAIREHSRTDVRLKAVHLLGATGHPDAANQLRELATKDGIGEVVKTALLEALYKLDRDKLVENSDLGDMEIEHHSQLLPDSHSLSSVTSPEFDNNMTDVFEVKLHEGMDEIEG